MKLSIIEMDNRIYFHLSSDLEYVGPSCDCGLILSLKYGHCTTASSVADAVHLFNGGVTRDKNKT